MTARLLTSLLALTLLCALCAVCAGAVAAPRATPVQVQLKLASANTLTVKVSSAKQSCRKGRLAEFFQRSFAKGGSYTQIGAEYTNAKGEYTSGLLDEGLFYVKVRPETKGGVRCAGGRSTVVKIKPS